MAIILLYTGSDYSTLPQTPVAIEPGEKIKCIPISISDDTIVERPENIVLSIQIDGDPAVSSTVINIADNDGKCTCRVWFGIV